MGAWGFAPTDCDGGDEWLFALWRTYPFQNAVERTLNLKVDDDHQAIRAAAFLLHEMRNVLAWDPDDYSRLALLAIRKLEEIGSMEIYSDPDFQKILAQEIEQLRGSLE